jgi:hypothetical protein
MTEKITKPYMNFKDVVLATFDNKEFVTNWERLREKKLTPKTMRLFIKDVKNLIWDRLPKVCNQ